MSRQSRYCDHFMYGCLVLFAFSLPLSIAVSQGALILALMGWGVKIVLEKRLNWERTPLDYPLLAFLAAGFLSALLGFDPAKSLAGLRTFWTFLIIFILYNNVRDAGRVKLLISALIAGAVVTSLYEIVLNSAKLLSGIEPDLLGSMSRAGQLMLICGVASAYLLYKKDMKGRMVLLLVVAVLVSAEILQFKRGSWIALFCVLMVQGLMKSRKIILPVIAIFAALFCLYQPARGRLLNIRREFSQGTGGRIEMWRTAPSIMRDYPVGTGLDNVETLMYMYNPSIELKEGRERHSHLHNSYLQVLVETGPLGLGAFLSFCAVFLLVSYRLFRRVREKYPYEKSLLLGSFSSFVGFLVNGLFEHNFGDSEVVMVVFFLMGLTFIIGGRTLYCGIEA